MRNWGLRIALRRNRDDALRRHPDAKAVLITSPTITALLPIRKRSRKLRMLLHSAVVDEAHGAHLRFCPADLPEDAIAQGADLVSQSSHKTIAR
jgi:arginine/lysine/ornithine decarboxylase